MRQREHDAVAAARNEYEFIVPDSLLKEHLGRARKKPPDEWLGERKRNYNLRRKALLAAAGTRHEHRQQRSRSRAGAEGKESIKDLIV